MSSKLSLGPCSSPLPTPSSQTCGQDMAAKTNREKTKPKKSPKTERLLVRIWDFCRTWTAKHWFGKSRGGVSGVPSPKKYEAWGGGWVAYVSQHLEVIWSRDPPQNFLKKKIGLEPLIKQKTLVFIGKICLWTWHSISLKFKCLLETHARAFFF